MNGIKETKFDRFIFETGKIFISIIIILTPVLYTQSLSIDFYIAYKIAFCFLFILDYMFVLFIIDRASSKNYNYIVKENNNKDIKENIKTEVIEEENHQITIDEFLEEKDKEEK